MHKPILLHIEAFIVKRLIILAKKLEDGISSNVWACNGITWKVKSGSLYNFGSSQQSVALFYLWDRNCFAEFIIRNHYQPAAKPI